MDAVTNMRTWHKVAAACVVVILIALIGYVIYDQATHTVKPTPTPHQANDPSGQVGPSPTPSRLIPSSAASSEHGNSVNDDHHKQNGGQHVQPTGSLLTNNVPQQQLQPQEQLELKAMFDAWKLKFSKNYSSDAEEMHRFQQWVENKRFIDQFNAGAQLSGSQDSAASSDSLSAQRNQRSSAEWQPRFQLALNQYADLSADEMNRLVLGNTQARNTAQPLQPPPSDQSLALHAAVSIPRVIDWRRAAADDSHTDKCYVDERVYDQGQCTIGHVIATLSTVEAYQRIKNGWGADTCAALSSNESQSLSHQQLIDCMQVAIGQASNDLCTNAGHMVDVYKYISKIPVRTSNNYRTGLDCNSLATTSSGGAGVGVRVSAGVVNRNDIVDVLASHPLTVAIDASRPTFHFYSGGIYNDQACSQTQYNHHMMLLGYDNNQRVWTLKNSLGQAWGERGFMRLEQDACGIEHDVFYPKM